MIGRSGRIGRIARVMLAIPAIGLGVAAVVFLRASMKEPPRRPHHERAQSVRVITVPRLGLVPRATGHGIMSAGRSWRALPQVGGTIVHLSPLLKVGQIVPEGELLVRIDPEEYELAVAREMADIGTTEARVSENEIQEANARASLKIEERALALAESELKRLNDLLLRGSATPSDVEREERSCLVQRMRVQEIRNQLNTLPAQRRTLEAQLKVHNNRLAVAKLNIGRTKIVSPFNCRITSVQAEESQLATPLQALFSANGIAVAEVPARLPISRLGPLIPQNRIQAPLTTEKLVGFARKLGLSARVRHDAGPLTNSWPARIARFLPVDARTQSVGVVVAIDRPYEGASPGKRPPAMTGMYVEVELRGAILPGRVVVPRSAVRDGRIFVVDASNRLRRQRVEIAFAQRSLAVISSGLEGGEVIVVSDLIPAIEGMLLDPQPDPEVLDRLKALATGKARGR